MKQAEALRIFTDGSCHVESRLGVWGALLLIEDRELIISDWVEQTTHNRMELTAVIKAIEYVHTQNVQYKTMQIYSDSQYVVNIPNRKKKLLDSNFQNKAGQALNNHDLLKTFIKQFDCRAVQLIKVKAHQKKSTSVNYNRKIDQWVRKLLRRQLTNRINTLRSDP
ncbi:MAG: RNase H family protein [Bacteroidota bacterium]